LRAPDYTTRDRRVNRLNLSVDEALIGSSAFLGPPMSPLSQWIDAWLREPLGLVAGWPFWELYKRNAEWFKQRE
jgi:hypothetical protein